MSDVCSHHRSEALVSDDSTVPTNVMVSTMGFLPFALESEIFSLDGFKKNSSIMKIYIFLVFSRGLKQMEV